MGATSNEVEVMALLVGCMGLLKLGVVGAIAE